LNLYFYSSEITSPFSTSCFRIALHIPHFRGFRSRHFFPLQLISLILGCWSIFIFKFSSGVGEGNFESFELKNRIFETEGEKGGKIPS